MLDWWREVIQGGHLELSRNIRPTTTFSTIRTCRRGALRSSTFFQNVVGVKPANPIPATLAPAPVVSGAKGDFVFLIFEQESPDPRDATKTYHHNSFEVLRLANGKVQEHWDSFKRMAAPPGAPKPAPFEQPASQMARGSLGSLSADEQRNLQLATSEMKDMLQYGHLELADTLMDPGYIQHNPNVPQGRDGFKQFMSRTPGRTPREIKPEWVSAPSLTLVSGPYVLMMWDRKDKDPNDPAREYVWNHFDVIRVENGLIKEHWDEAVVAAPAAR